VAYVAKLGYLDGHDHAMVDGDRVIQAIEGMERACFQETNRLMRIRMLGGVGGAPGKSGPYPDPFVTPFLFSDRSRKSPAPRIHRLHDHSMQNDPTVR
jgi:hypothetical protein